MSTWGNRRLQEQDEAIYAGSLSYSQAIALVARQDREEMASKLDKAVFDDWTRKSGRVTYVTINAARDMWKNRQDRIDLLKREVADAQEKARKFVMAKGQERAALIKVNDHLQAEWRDTAKRLDTALSGLTQLNKELDIAQQKLQARDLIIQDLEARLDAATAPKSLLQRIRGK